MKFRLARGLPDDFDVFPFYAGGPTGTECFECRFLGGETGGIVDFRLRAFLAVFDLPFCIYSMKEALAEPLNGISDSLVLNDVDADAGDHGLLCYR